MRRAVAACWMALCGATGAVAVGAVTDQPAPAVQPSPQPEVVPRAKFVRAVDGWRHARAQVKALRRTLAAGPDFRVSLQLAAIVYGQDWRALRACALTEGYRTAERHQRGNARPNATGSGATGAFQFMRGTFLSTPFAGLDWTRQDVQAFAAAWMWQHGRRNEWAGAGC